MDRIIGYLPPGEYLSRIQDIRENKHTLDDYLTRYKNGEVTSDIIAGIAMKFEGRGEDNKANDYYTILVKDFPNDSSEYFQRGIFFMASLAFENGNKNALNVFIETHRDSPFIEDAHLTMVYHYADTEQRDEELHAYKKMIAQFPDSPGVLNSYAWRMAEIETNLEDALLKARKAVLLSRDNPDRQAGIIDTEAEVLWKLKRYDEAIETIEKAIIIEPANQYFRDQKEKILESKQTDFKPA